MDLSGSRIWLTGASSGIGAALAQELVRRGARVALTARRAEPLEAFCATHPECMAMPGDVTDRDRMLAIGAELVERWGGVDMAILNAGTYRPVTLDTLEAGVFREHFDINVMGTVHGLEAVLPGMRAARSGLVAVVASVTGFAGLPLAAAYGSTKAYLISMCDSLRPDLVSEGIDVTVIAPGFVRTPLTTQNPFPMPFAISVERAARIICDGLEKRRPEIVFPWQMALLMKGLRLAPGRLRRSYVARLAAKRRADTT